MIKTDNLKKIYIVSAVVGILNVLLSGSQLMYLIVAAEIIFLLYLLINKNFIGYFCYYIIFICLSLEFDVFSASDKLYSLKNTRFLGVNLGVWLMMPFVLWGINNIGAIIKNTEYKTFSNVGKGFLGINIIAAIIGFFSILLNENDIWQMDNYVLAYTENFYSFFVQPFLLFLALASILKKDSKRVVEIGASLHAILLSNIVMMLTSLASGINGKYGVATTAMTSLTASFVCFLPLYPFMEENKHKVFNVIIGMCGVILLLLRGQSGKLFISLIILLCVFILQTFKSHSLNKRIIGIIILFSGFIMVIAAIAYMNTSNNVLFLSKIYQAKEVLSVNKWSMDYFRNMQNSPRVRFGEIIDIALEFFQKPWFIITGKGYGGTIRDWSGILYLTPEAERSGGFSLREYANGTFYNVHEIATPLLAFGLIGVMFYLKCVKLFWRNVTRNYWLLIAIVWFPFYYGYSFTLGVFGVTSLYYGLIKCDLVKKEIGEPRIGIENKEQL